MIESPEPAPAPVGTPFVAGAFTAACFHCMHQGRTTIHSSWSIRPRRTYAVAAKALARGRSDHSVSPLSTLTSETTCWSSGDAGCRAWSIDVQKSAIGTLPIYSPMRLRALVPTVPRVILPFRRGQLQVGFRRAPGRSYARCALIKLSAVSDGRRGNRRRRRRILIGRHLIGWTAARGRWAAP